MLEDVFGELIEAREKLDAARTVFRAALNHPGVEADSLRIAVSRLERMAGEVARIEEHHVEQAVAFAK